MKLMRNSPDLATLGFSELVFPVFPTTSKVAWDCQTLECPGKTEGSWVIAVGDSEQITIGYPAPPSGEFEVVIMIEGRGPKRCIGWTEFYLKRITRRAPGLRMGEGAWRGCDYCLASRRGLPSTGKTVVKECFRVARPETIAKGDRHFPASGAYMS
jgi:hypothetical protein